MVVFKLDILTHQVSSLRTSDRHIYGGLNILAEGAIALSVTLSGGALFAS